MLERFSNPDWEIGMRRSAQRDRVKMRLLCKRLQKLHGASFMSYAGRFPLNGVGGTHVHILILFISFILHFLLFLPIPLNLHRKYGDSWKQNHNCVGVCASFFHVL